MMILKHGLKPGGSLQTFFKFSTPPWYVSETHVHITVMCILGTNIYICIYIYNNIWISIHLHSTLLATHGVLIYPPDICLFRIVGDNGSMHSDLYAFVLSCFKYMEAHDTIKPDDDRFAVLTVDEEVGCSGMNYVYDFDGWTFDTCSPRQLRFSQRGATTPYSMTAVPVWKCLMVDLLAEDVVIKEDPGGCNVVFSMPNPEYRLLVLRACVIDTMKQVALVCLRSVSLYSDIRMKITAEATGLPFVLASLCESFYFCPDCWRSTVADKRFECNTPCESCAQYNAGSPPGDRVLHG
jgi:hypothetical protein